MVRTQIQLTDRQAEKLKRIAARQGVSMAEIIRRAVDLVIERPIRPSEENVRSRALSAAGKIRAGRDLARAHDDHLSDIYR